jgi:hypothetical protein
MRAQPEAGSLKPSSTLAPEGSEIFVQCGAMGAVAGATEAAMPVPPTTTIVSRS